MFDDPSKQRDYQRAWHAQRKREFFADKECVHCGATEGLALGDRDGGSLRRNRCGGTQPWSLSRERFEREVVPYAIVLCGSCLRERVQAEHKPLLGQVPEREEVIRVLWAIADNEGCTRRELQKIVGMKRDSLGRIVDELRERRLIRSKQQQTRHLIVNRWGYEVLIETAEAVGSLRDAA